ncbi:hypothetical protein PVL29_014371 [Vitis rotundifolia]|uniref:Phytocyanin domain-containing protein n=1 Tax=Vitis rotundifolia TaxID=103349 RepID=A0AA38ZGW1_VITRO|nr:hypothetical protein PVL29_014371 [Vitis rotundifolia]
MAGRVNMVLVVLVAASVLHRTAAKTYVVGNELYWRVPPNTTAYSTWASAYTFRVGDTLVFNFTTGLHDVAKVTQKAFDACNSSSPLTLLNNGPANYTLNSTGENYFFCTVDSHCSQGQKLSISVSASSNESPASPPPPGTTSTPSPPPPGTTSTPSPPPPGTTSTHSPPPPPSSAPSLAAATISVIFMSIATGFLW